MKIKKRSRFNKHKEWVTKAMEENEMARNSDWHLLFTVLKNRGIILNNSTIKEIINSEVNMHTLLRERQRIQSKGKLMPTDIDVLKRRRQLKNKYRNNYKIN